MKANSLVVRNCASFVLSIMYQTLKIIKTCQMCQRKHHTSICDNPRNLILAIENPAIHPIVVIALMLALIHA